LKNPTFKIKIQEAADSYNKRAFANRSLTSRATEQLFSNSSKEFELQM
jgi:hypothetical protein